MQPVDAAPPSEPRSRRFRPKDWRDPAAIGGILTAITALVAAVAALRQPPPPEKKAEAAYETLAAEIKRQNETIQRLHADQLAMRSWLRGFYKAQGIEVADALVPPQPVKLELKDPEPSAPVVSMLRPAESPRQVAEPTGVRVLTPLPRLAPKPADPALPSADAL